MFFLLRVSVDEMMEQILSYLGNSIEVVLESDVGFFLETKSLMGMRRGDFQFRLSSHASRLSPHWMVSKLIHSERRFLFRSVSFGHCDLFTHFIYICISFSPILRAVFFIHSRFIPKFFSKF